MKQAFYFAVLPILFSIPAASAGQPRNCPDTTMPNYGLLTTAFCATTNDNAFRSELSKLPIPKTPETQAVRRSIDTISKKFWDGGPADFSTQLRGAACGYAYAMFGGGDSVDTGMLGMYLPQTFHDGLAQHVMKSAFTRDGVSDICTGALDTREWRPFQYDWKKRNPATLPEFPLP